MKALKRIKDGMLIPFSNLMKDDPRFVEVEIERSVPAPEARRAAHKEEARIIEEAKVEAPIDLAELVPTEIKEKVKGDKIALKKKIKDTVEVVRT